jgi:hypothetical protein
VIDPNRRHPFVGEYDDEPEHDQECELDGCGRLQSDPIHQRTALLTEDDKARAAFPTFATFAAGALAGWIDGCDVSHWQSSSTHAGVFMIPKATQGLTVVDSGHDGHVAYAGSHGIYVPGDYHFFTTAGTPEQQADFFLAHRVRGKIAFVDWEMDPATRTTPTQADTQRALDRIKAKGRRNGIYATPSNVHRVHADVYWPADLSGSPAGPAQFWQWTWDPFDLDRFHGTLDQLKALAEGKPDPTGGPDMDPSNEAAVAGLRLAAGTLADPKHTAAIPGPKATGVDGHTRNVAILVLKVCKELGITSLPTDPNKV